MDMNTLRELIEKVKSGELSIDGALSGAAEMVKKDIDVTFTYDREKDQVLMGGLKKGPKFGLSPEQWEKVGEKMPTCLALCADVRAGNVKDSDLEPAKKREAAPADAAPPAPADADAAPEVASA